MFTEGDNINTDSVKREQEGVNNVFGVSTNWTSVSYWDTSWETNLSNPVTVAKSTVSNSHSRKEICTKRVSYDNNSQLFGLYSFDGIFILDCICKNHDFGRLTEARRFYQNDGGIRQFMRLSA